MLYVVTVLTSHGHVSSEASKSLRTSSIYYLFSCLLLNIRSIGLCSRTSQSHLLSKVPNGFRYSRHDKRSKLPGWILSQLRDAHLNLSTDMAVHIAREVCVIFNHLLFLLQNNC